MRSRHRHTWRASRRAGPVIAAGFAPMATAVMPARRAIRRTESADEAFGPLSADGSRLERNGTSYPVLGSLLLPD